MDASDYVVGSWLFLRGLGLIYLIAFTSLGVQVRGLIGQRGILPAAEHLARLRWLGRRRYWRAPTVLHLVGGSDRALLLVCWGGAAAAALATVGLFALPALAVCWLCYLSLEVVCRDFLSFQWDALLLEMGVLGLLLAPFSPLPEGPLRAPAPLALLLLWWLAFRLVFSSGVVKLASGDPSWRGLTAMCHHYETQPLPSPLSWYAHHLPRCWHRLETFATLVLELVVPLGMFAPQPWRGMAAATIALFMCLVMATGNYGFFNLQTIVLMAPLIDDASYAQVLGLAAPAVPLAAAGWPGWVLAPIALLLFALSLCYLWLTLLPHTRLPRWLLRPLAALAPLRLASGYGLFAVMTTERPEIVIEASDDLEHWQPYEFRYKPGAPQRRPRWNLPHQPRLDWQLWFAALGTLWQHPWFAALMQRLLQASPEVRALFARAPFGQRPPRYVRAVLYDYRFSSPELRRRTGAWWQRRRLGLYCPPLTLRGGEVLVVRTLTESGEPTPGPPPEG
ncbi:MAG: membrane protein [Planctomycetota bacterium]|nr:MAG: membrane protein [Planctomycetota bacterium]